MLSPQITHQRSPLASVALHIRRDLASNARQADALQGTAEAIGDHLRGLDVELLIGGGLGLKDFAVDAQQRASPRQLALYLSQMIVPPRSDAMAPKMFREPAPELGSAVGAVETKTLAVADPRLAPRARVETDHVPGEFRRSDGVRCNQCRDWIADHTICRRGYRSCLSDRFPLCSGGCRKISEVSRAQWSDRADADGGQNGAVEHGGDGAKAKATNLFRAGDRFDPAGRRPCGSNFSMQLTTAYETQSRMDLPFGKSASRWDTTL